MEPCSAKHFASSGSSFLTADWLVGRCCLQHVAGEDDEHVRSMGVPRVGGAQQHLHPNPARPAGSYADSLEQLRDGAVGGHDHPVRDWNGTWTMFAIPRVPSCCVTDWAAVWLATKAAS